MSDYYALAQHHYRKPAPAVPVLTLRARCESTKQTVGVLVVTMPVLNGPWREGVWPDLSAGLTNAQRAVALCASVRTMARVVVVPAWRARGIATLLVTAYLRAPLTPRTEALAAMACHCPLFESAGMRRVEWPPGRTRRGLTRAIERAGLSPWMLADRRARCVAARSPHVQRALRALAIDRCRPAARADPRVLIERLWPVIASRPLAFVYDTPQRGES